jgi:hypothetical protein
MPAGRSSNPVIPPGLLWVPTLRRVHPEVFLQLWPALGMLDFVDTGPYAF